MPINLKQLLAAFVALSLIACGGASDENVSAATVKAEEDSGEVSSDRDTPSSDEVRTTSSEPDVAPGKTAVQEKEGSATVVYGGETYELEIYQCNRDDSLGDIGVVDIWAIESGAAMPDLGVIRLHIFTRGYSTVVTFMLDGEADVNIEQTGEDRVRFVDGVLAFENDDIKIEVRC